MVRARCKAKGAAVPTGAEKKTPVGPSSPSPGSEEGAGWWGSINVAW